MNLPKMWDDMGYGERKKLQNLMFPEGISYNKKNNICRTPRFNSSFLWILERMQVVSRNKVGIPEMNLTYPKVVAPLGIEPRSEVPETSILSVVLQSQFVFNLPKLP